MKKIAIDISPIQYIGTGVARYTLQLVQNLIQLDRENHYTLFYNSFGNRLRTVSGTEEFFNRQNITVREFFFPEKILRFLWNTLEIMPLERFIGRHDIVFYSDWFMPPSSAQHKVTTVHDLVFAKYPSTVQPTILSLQKNRLARARRENFAIIVDSYATKNDLLTYTKFKEDAVRVIYPGVTAATQDDEFCEKTLGRLKLTKPYILAVGKLEPRKNLSRLIKAFESAQLPDVELVIVGPKGWEDVKEAHNVRIVGYVKDDELYALYQRALFFIFPSLYEGFGFPLLEAMSLGCPTAASNTSSLKELGEGASLLFDPSNVESITGAIKTMASDTRARHDFVQKGLRRSHEFTWEKTAQQVLTIFKTL